MGFDAPKAKADPKTSGVGRGSSPDGAGKGRFQIPDGYFESYLRTGAPDAVDFARLRQSGELEKAAAEEGPELVQAYGAWLWRALGLAELVQEYTGRAPAAERRAIGERLHTLGALDRRALSSAIEQAGL